MTDFKMTDEQKALFDKLTKLQRRMALNDIVGMKPAENHKEAGGVCKNEGNRAKLASEILNNPDVLAFLDSMKAAAVSDAVMSREKMMERHTKIINIGAASLDGMSLEKLTEHKAALDIQLKAMNQLADLAGYKAAQKHDHTVKSVNMEIAEDTSPQDAANIYKTLLGE